MENKVEKIMKNYKKELTKFDKKYEVKSVKIPDTKDLEDKIKYEKEFIAKLEFEGKETNKEMIDKAKERLELAMSEKAEIDSKYEKDLLKRQEKELEKKQLKNSKVVLESGREVTMAEKDKLDMAKLKDTAIKDLTSERKTISETLVQKKAELESKRKEWNEFKYEYEKDENGKLKSEPINVDEVKKIHAEFDNINKEITELEDMQKQCDEYLNELKAPTKEDKDFSKAWNDAYKQQKEKQESKQAQPEQTEPVQSEPVQNQPKRTQPVQSQPEQNQPKRTQPVQSQPVQNQPKQTEPVQTEPVKNQPKQTEPVQSQPVQKQPENRKPAQRKENAIKSISINASEGTAIVKSADEEYVISIEEAIKNKKTIYQKSYLDAILEEKGIDIPLAKFIFKRRVNPVILKAIEADAQMVEEYVESLMDNDKPLPFEYKHNLENSILSSKSNRLMHRAALKEQKIQGTDVIGAERFYGVKNLFRNIKEKVQKLKEAKEPEKLPSGEETAEKKSYNLRQDPNIVVKLEELENDKKTKIEEKYQGLSEEQKQELSGISIKSMNASELQTKYKLSNDEVYNLVEQYGKKEEKMVDINNMSKTEEKEEEIL